MTGVTEAFLNALFGHEVGPQAQVVVWSKTRGSAWCSSSEEAATSSARVSPAEDTYYGVCLQDPEAVAERIRSTRGESPNTLQYYRGYAATAAVMPGLWLDIDVASGEHKKAGLPKSIEEATAFLGSFPFQPSLIVQSGGGLHLYWLFDNPWVLEDEEERGLAAAMIRRWQERIRKHVGFTIDSTHDLSRVLRAPGTINHKYGTEVTVDGLEAVQRFDRADLQTYVEDGGQLTLVSDAVIVDPPAKVAISADAQPPSEKLLDLMNLHPTFAATWRRERKDLPSQSEYDLSLASMTAKMGWNPDEIAALMVAHRRQGGEPLKLDRPGYYQRTIAKAMSENAQTIAHDRLSERVDSVEMGETSIEDERRGMYSDLSAMIGVHIIKIIRFLADPPQFRLVMEEGSIDLGGAETLLSANKFRVKVAGLSKRLIGRFSGQQWDPIAQAMLRAAVDEDLGADSTPEGLVTEWVGEYLNQNRPESDRAHAISLRVPFWRGDEVMIFLSGFQQWLGFFRNERISRKQLGILLRTAGCAPRTIWFKDEDGGESSTYCWSVPGGLHSQRSGPHTREQSEGSEEDAGRLNG